jgi:hypothetical protein
VKGPTGTLVAMASGTLMILGSGEIAPSMVKVYRRVLSNLEPRRGVLLDTPYGFQENVPQLTEKIVSYFDVSLQVKMQPLPFPRLEGTSALERTTYVDTVRRASFVFAGPGSPSYAMRQWGDLGLQDALDEVLDRGGIVCFASAAALTLGGWTAPIYEIYKVGLDPHWIDGLDVLGRHGLRCTVIPHFDNAEGGNHDTRYCYLGQRRLLNLEGQLPPGVSVLGVDEHTAAVLNLATDRLAVYGRGAVHWDTGDSDTLIGDGEEVDLASWRNADVAPRDHANISEREVSTAEALGEAAARGDASSLSAIAELVRRAAEGGEGTVEAAPLVEGVLNVRSAARAAGQYGLADQLRDVLVASGIEVRDGDGSSHWTLAPPSDHGRR